jgi:hypothetical protein
VLLAPTEAGPAEAPTRLAPRPRTGEPGAPETAVQPRRFVPTLQFVAIAGVVALGLIAFAAAAPAFSPLNPIVRYGLRVSTIGAAVVGFAAYLWCRRTGRTWDADVIATMWAALSTLTLIVSLHGTPFGALGIQGDQSFRTETVTRFADTWHLSDYFYANKPSYYAPLYFWILGRASDVLGTAPWHMIKYGEIAGTYLAPLVIYLLWRRHVPARIAALIAGVALVLAGFYAPYSYLTFLAFVPWWIEVMHGPLREGAAKRGPIVLGLIGAVIFLTYYYYFFLAPFVLIAHIVAMRLLRRRSWPELRRSLQVLVVAAVGSSVFWAPLLWNFLTARQFYSLNNRWLQLDHGDLLLPMFDVSIVGALCLIGFLYLVLTAKTRVLSQALLVVFVATYLWHVAGFFFIVVNEPLMSYAMKNVSLLVLCFAAVLALVDLARLARERFDPAQVRTVTLVMTVLLAIFVADRNVSMVADHPWIKAAQEQPLPDGSLPTYHDLNAQPAYPAYPSAVTLKAYVDANYHGQGHALLLSDRNDLFAFYPYYGFVQWDFSYSHPTAEFENRLAFLSSLATATPAQFAAKTADNPYDHIDAFVLKRDGDQLTYHYLGLNYPSGSYQASISWPASVLSDQYFETTQLGDYVVAVRK